MSIVSLSLPKDLLQELDSTIKEDRNTTRSEVIRQALRKYLTEYYELDKIEGNVIATITVLYEKTEKNKELYQLTHEFDDMITAYLHAHLNEENCLEVIVIKGNPKRLKDLVDALKSNKPVKQIRISIMSTNKN